MFGLRDAAIVREVARAGGFRAASEGLRLAPSAVSARIAVIEERLGLVLFDRSRRGAGLTPAGRRFLERATALLDMRDAIAADMAAEAGQGGTLRIGVAETVVHTSLPALLRRLADRAPRLRLELSVDVSENLARALAEEAVDIALLLRQAVPRGAASRPIQAVPLDWYAAPGLAGLAQDAEQTKVTETTEHTHQQGAAKAAIPVPPAFLGEHSVITFARGTPPAREAERLLTRAEGPRATLHYSSALSTMIHLSRSGFAVATLPVALAAEEVAAGRLLRLDPGPEHRLSPLEFELCHRAPSAAPFAAMLSEPLGEGV
ncbi:MAG: LysR family transcriptional regulator [Pseudomonadota bacterium]